MKILVLEGSPHKNGSSNILANKFIEGVRENGHDVKIISAAHSKVGVCFACNACLTKGECVQKDDDMKKIEQAIMESDMVVFVTPIYYFGMSAQLKTVIDRFYSFNQKLTEKRLKTALITTAWDFGENVREPISLHYKTICNYLHFIDCGMILGEGCGTPSMTLETEFPQKAYEFGKSIS